jgi:SulP family sulfate permease
MRLFRIDESYLQKSVICLRNYDSRKFIADLIAGLTVGLVALPLAMAFAIYQESLPNQEFIVPSSPAF